MELNDCEKCEGFIREAELKRQLAEKNKEIAELKARIEKAKKQLKECFLWKNYPTGKGTLSVPQVCPERERLLEILNGKKSKKK